MEYKGNRREKSAERAIAEWGTWVVLGLGPVSSRSSKRISVDDSIRLTS